MLGSMCLWDRRSASRRVGEDALAFVAQGQVDRGRNLLPDGGVSLDPACEWIPLRRASAGTIGQGFVFAQKSQQQMLVSI